MEKHFCVSVYTFSQSKKKFLLIKHRKTGKWLQPGGHIEANEDPEEAAIRETFEETGIKVKLMGNRVPRESDFIKPLALQKNVVTPDHIHIDIVYWACPLKNQTEFVNYSETEGLGWFSLEEIMDSEFETFDDVRDWCKSIWEDYIFEKN